MADMSATDPSDFFKFCEAARLVNKDLKPMGPADSKQVGLIWRTWLAFLHRASGGLGRGAKRRHRALLPTHRMVEFSATHFDLLSRFASRVATGITGDRLNAMAWSRGWPTGKS